MRFLRLEFVGQVSRFRLRANSAATLSFAAALWAISASSGLPPNLRNNSGVSTVSMMRGTDETAEDRHGDRMQDLASRLIAPISRGTSARPAASAVIRTGVSRSRLPRITSWRPNVSPSLSARLI